jgi:hypothetical protein
LLRSLLENGVNRAQAGRHAGQVVHEFKGSAKRNVAHHRERHDDLIEPLGGDRQHEKHLICVGCPRGIEGFIERCTGSTDLSVVCRRQIGCFESWVPQMKNGTSLSLSVPGASQCVMRL